MAINIPSIKRAEPVSQGSIGRDQTQAPSAEPYIKNLNTIASVFEKGADLAFKYEKQAQDTELRDLTNKYKAALYGTGEEKESWTVTRFQNTPKDGQDLTPAFAGYQEYKQSLRGQIMSEARGGVADRLKTELADVDFYADRSVNVEFYKANNVRKDKVYNASIDLIKQVDIPAAVGAYNPKDPETIAQLRMTFEKIAQLSEEHGLGLGFKEGDSVLKSMMLEDVGDAVVKSVNDALSIKDTDKATQIWMQFGKYIPNKKSETIKTKIADIVIDKEIDSYVTKFASLAEDKGIDAINTQVPEQLRPETIKRYSTYKLNESQMRKHVSEQIEREAYMMIQKKAEQGNPYLSVNQFENESSIKDAIDNARLLPEGRQRLRSRLGEAPGVSDPEVKKYLEDRYHAGEITAIPQIEYDKMRLQLTKPDRTDFDNKRTGTVGLNGNLRGRMTADMRVSLYPGKWSDANTKRWNDYVEPYLRQKFEELPNKFEGTTGKNAGQEYDDKLNIIREDLMRRWKEMQNVKSKFPSIEYDREAKQIWNYKSKAKTIVAPLIKSNAPSIPSGNMDLNSALDRLKKRTSSQEGTQGQ